MQLQDIENDVLWNTQQSEMVNFGSAPNWTASTNPALAQTALDFQINRAYMRVIQDLADIQIALYRVVYSSLAQVADYPLPPLAPPQNTLLNASLLGSMQLGAPPPSGPGVWGQGQWDQMIWGDSSETINAPAVQRVTRVIYGPVGQPWTQDYEGGIRLVSWQEFMRRTGFGYLRPFTFGIMPDYAAVTPQRNAISFFPGSASAGDTIGIEYVPKLTPNTAWPPLQAESDTPNLPEETHDLIVLWATKLCWYKLREMEAAQEFERLYNGGPMEKYTGGELGRIRDALKDRSTGDTLCIRDANDGLALSTLIGGVIVP